MITLAMLSPPTTAELLLRGLSVGSMMATVVGMWRMPVSRNAKVATTIFFTAVSGYVLDAYGRAVMLVGFGYPICWLLDAGIAGYVWMMILVVFEDRKVSPLILAPAVLQTALDVTGSLTHASPNGLPYTIRDGISLLLAAHALLLVFRGWRGDLVEARRRLRGPFMATVALFVIVQTLLDSIRRHGVAMDWMPLANAAAVAVITVIGAGIFLDGRGVIFGASRFASPAPGAPAAADEAGLSRLLQAMDAEMLWRQEGLTIGKLAERIGVPEHRLRRLINDHLGHRNFTDFVNSRRIEAAKRVLSDPTQARTTVAAIAYDHGFASLGPFNRAFKAETGASPREWRQREQAKAAGATAAE
jgi:AraC-like DNA-binding protein